MFREESHTITASWVLVISFEVCRFPSRRGWRALKVLKFQSMERRKVENSELTSVSYKRTLFLKKRVLSKIYGPFHETGASIIGAHIICYHIIKFLKIHLTKKENITMEVLFANKSKFRRILHWRNIHHSLRLQRKTYNEK